MKMKNLACALEKGIRSSIAKFKTWLHASPRLSLGVMALLMICSAVLCFTLKRHPGGNPVGYPANLKSTLSLEPRVNAEALLEIISLQSELKTFLDKKIPSTQDSLRMEALLKRISLLNQKLKENEKN